MRKAWIIYWADRLDQRLARSAKFLVPIAGWVAVAAIFRSELLSSLATITLIVALIAGIIHYDAQCNKTK